MIASQLVRLIVAFLTVSAAWANQSLTLPAAATVQEFTHFSQALGGDRPYRVFLPPAYANSTKRYPAVYWFQGRDQTSEISSYVAAHDVLVVDTGPVETSGEFPLYFPELVDHVDQTLRTVADRDHRAVAGFSLGGYLAYWTAGKYPGLVSSAAALTGFHEAVLGPRGFDVECSLDDVSGNYDGVRTRLFTEPAAVAQLLDFVMRAFAEPPPKPTVFSHADPYPNFAVWGWDVTSDRRQPGYTELSNVSSMGFSSVVREWLPGGAAISTVKLSIASPRLYPPGSAHPVTYIRVKDGKVRRAVQKADAEGRLNFELDGDAYEVGVSAAPLLAVSGYEIADAGWATAGRPAKLRVRFCNKGSASSNTLAIHWESADPSVRFDFPTSRLYGLKPGECGALPVTVTADDPASAVLQIVAADGVIRWPIAVPQFPSAETVKDFQIADGRPLDVYQHGTQHSEITLGEGNGDGFAAPGESFAVLLPDGEPYRAAELFTNDACVDNTVRLSDAWSDHESAKYSVARIRLECQPGHVVHLLAKVVTPDHRTRYAAVEFPVWWRHPGDAVKK